MVVFALISLVLFAIAGLAVDAGVSYYSSDQLQRAADAAALAGVAYLPGQLPQAVNAALVESARNGFDDAGTVDGSGNTACAATASPCVEVTQPASNELTVTITVSVPTTFLSLLGFGTHPVTRSATAEYLPPIALGQPGAQQGSSDPQLGTSGNYYFERTEGWGTPRSQGDPYTPSPNQGGNGCGPSGGACSATSAPDVHLISPAAGSEPEAASATPGRPGGSINYTGGSSYLIDVPPGQSVDPQIFNPSFVPDGCGNNVTTTYCYHESDGTFSAGTPTAYAAMAYSIFSVPSLSQPGAGRLLSQEVFYPIDDTGKCSGFCRITADGSFATLTANGASTGPACTPDVYQQWVSALDYSPDTCDEPIFQNTYGTGLTALTDPSAGVDAYYRLEVDTLQWNGAPICTTAAQRAGAESTSTATSTYPEAHKGYAVRLAAPGSGTVCSSATSSCPGSTVSALGDMIVFTPVINPSSTRPFSFSIPLFQLAPQYAGATIDVNIFDPGDVGGGPAYMAIVQPDGSLASAGGITDTGNTLGSGGTASVPAASPWPVDGAACSACFQTANSSGGAIYNGQWVQVHVTVPTALNVTSPGSACATLTQDRCWSRYWTLEYEVSPNVHSDDTFAVSVSYAGSPDRLLP